MRKSVTFELHLPKRVRVDSVAIGTIPLDESWIVTVREGHMRVGDMPLGVARRKFA